MAETPEGTPNNWQRIAIATNDWATPANAIDAVAFGMAMHAASRLDTPAGIIEACAALMADFVDGKVARATGTSSDIGEAIDAGLDKVKLGRYLVSAWKDNLAPKLLLAGVAAPNIANTAITVYDRRRNVHPQVHPNDDGKKGIWWEQWGLGLHVIGNVVEKKQPAAGKALKTAGTAMSVYGIYRGLKATRAYWRMANV
jgi:phosphatidylglycerophosphate synthase